MKLEITSDFKPTGDQPEAIRQLTEGFNDNTKHQCLLGVTGSGKTFTVANLIQEVQKPTLILSHNKTLAAQLYGEFKKFFPDNAVEYFVSYYDYYQPEAYLPNSNTYIEKDLSINKEIEKLRLSTTSSLLSGRKDVIVISSVSCLYGIGNPDDFKANVIHLNKGQRISRNVLLRMFVDALYCRNEIDFNRGNFRVKGESVDIFPAYSDIAYKLLFWDDEIDSLESFDPISGQIIESFENLDIYPANIFVTGKDRMHQAIREIQDDLFQRIEYFKSIGKHIEAKRIEERVSFDIEMIKELGHCPGVENYSRYFDGRDPGSRPFCLLDYFPDDFLTIIDESHVTIPQIRAMFGGDNSRKNNLVDYAFRLPAAIDNRPLKFEEFEGITNQIVYVSATPADYELEKSEGIIVEQVIRPTGIPDPIIEVRPSIDQIDDLINEIDTRISKKERTLVTTLTKRMAEELSKYFTSHNIKCRYIHSDVDTLERISILEDLRNGIFDVLIGVNLLREGLDLPEVSLVAILDADKEGFLRSTRSLTQTAGRAARNINGLVIMYADKITNSMQQTIEATNYRRKKQLDYNKEHGITPKQIIKSRESIIKQAKKEHIYIEPSEINIACDPVVQYMNSDALMNAIKRTKANMQKAAKEENFMEAARMRDEMFKLEKLLKKKIKA
jgi:excinuclease ABC subunit B